MELLSLRTPLPKWELTFEILLDKKKIVNVTFGPFHLQHFFRGFEKSIGPQI